MKWDKKRIKDLIVTDLIDGELDEATRKEVEAAIAQDEELQDFYRYVQKNIKEPFDKKTTINPPAEVWQSIEQRLNEEDQKENVFDDLLRNIKNLWAKPQVAYSFVGGVTFVIIIGLVLTVGQQTQRVTYDTDKQIEYLMLLVDGTQDENGEDGFDTTIENYFL